MSVDNQIEEYEEVDTTPTGSVEHREAVVTDTGVETTRFVSRVIQFIWLVFGIIEALIALRVFLELIGANPASFFANFIYSLTNLFLWPFAGLTATPSFNGMVLDIPAIIAMVVYAIAAWIITSLIWILFRPTSARSVRVSHRRIE
jgi:YggT family protein